MPQAAPAAAGDLRFRVRFDRKVPADNAGGDVESDWQEQFSRAADIRPMRGGEGVQQQRLVGTQPVLIIVRYDGMTKTVTPDWRAVEILNGTAVRYYALKTVEDMERGRAYISMMAVAGVADGGEAA